MSEFVRVYEVAPRDGLQNEKRIVPAAGKVRLVDMLSDCGFERIEAASFVSPKLVPQMADGALVLAGISRRPGILYAALVPNLEGYARARAAGTDEIAVFIAASEGFSEANTACSVAEGVARARTVAAAALGDGKPVRGYISCVVSCPYDGPVAPETVARLAGELASIGCYEISLGDTIGSGTPETIGTMLDAVIARIPAAMLAGHYHDTGGTALANIEASLARGLRTFDAAAGGLGGCPFAPGAKGNVDTRAVVRLLHAKGFVTGIDETCLATAAAFALSLEGASA